MPSVSDKASTIAAEISSWIAKISVRFAVVSLGPQVVAGFRFNKLRGHPNPDIRLANTAFQYMRHVELLGDVGDIGILALELKTRRPRGHPQVRNLGEQIEQLFGNAVGKIFLLGVGRHVHERQYGDGRCMHAARFLSVCRPCIRYPFGIRRVDKTLPLPDEIAERQNQDTNNCVVEFFAGIRGDGFLLVDFPGSLQDLRA